MTVATRRALEIVAFAAVPLAALVLGLSTFAGQDRLALDFHEEVYPQAKAVVRGDDPYPPAGTAITDTTNAIWPIAAVLPAVPLTALPPAAADWVATAVALATLVGALWTLGVRDWRVYGVTLLWPAVIDAYQTANVTLPLALLVALTWRYRDRRLVAGAALGAALALKFFLWPVAVWLAATGRHRAAAIGVAIGAASLLLLLPFIGIPDYLRLLRDLGDAFDGLSYTPYALLVDLGHALHGGPGRHARAGVRAGLGVLALAWRRRSLGLALAAALCLSPIVWRHFFALLIVPLGLVAAAIRHRVARPARPLGRHGDVQRGDLADRCGARLRRAHVRPLRDPTARPRRRAQPARGVPPPGVWLKPDTPLSPPPARPPVPASDRGRTLEKPWFAPFWVPPQV